jgi:hypothetical protein
VRGAVVGGVSLRGALARGPEDEVAIYLEAVEARIYGEERAEEGDPDELGGRAGALR